jgi:SAM-dependent methyltransferase
MGYQDQFKSSTAVRDYDEREYAVTSGSSVLWELEKCLLDSILERWARVDGRTVYLDFACGSGRVLAHLAPRMARSVGIDVSTEMLSLARKKVKSAELICKDIAQDDTEVEGTYDVITAFRFFSNAEDELRGKVMAGLARRMHSDSILIANTHTNPLSYKLVTWPYYEMQRVLGRDIHARYLTVSGLCELVQAAGLRPIAVLGCGFVPGKVLGLLGSVLAMKIELALADWRMLQKIGVDQLVVCGKG